MHTSTWFYMVLCANIAVVMVVFEPTIDCFAAEKVINLLSYLLQACSHTATFLLFTVFSVQLLGTCICMTSTAITLAINKCVHFFRVIFLAWFNFCYIFTCVTQFDAQRYCFALIIISIEKH